MQKNVVTGEVCATLLFCNIFQTDSTRGNNLKQEKRVFYHHLLLHMVSTCTLCWYESFKYFCWLFSHSSCICTLLSKATCV
jgi:hypothetical protein